MGKGACSINPGSITEVFTYSPTRATRKIENETGGESKEKGSGFSPTQLKGKHVLIDLKGSSATGRSSSSCENQ